MEAIENMDLHNRLVDCKDKEHWEDLAAHLVELIMNSSFVSDILGRINPGDCKLPFS